ncbi:MAG: hypothetical protein EU549_00275 [Promethearchaeota archaeon]|nr:MAG: hypothetical protein EU549_00275 [Candidatus Lokiarchaeota archaeon]
MKENYLIARGPLSLNGLEIIESNYETSEYIDNISQLVFDKIPQFIFQDLKNELTLILEDPKGYNITKIFKINNNLKYVLVRIEKKIYTKDEIKKISVNINKFLDYKLNFNKLSEKIQEFFVRLETYDFSRPIKINQISDSDLILKEEEKNTKIEDLLPEITHLRKSSNILDKLQFFKLKFLLNYRKKLSSEPGYNSSTLFSDFISYLKETEGHDLNKYEVSSVIYDFGLILNEIEFYNESNKAFFIASEKFEELNIDNLKYFSLFNILLNYNAVKEYERSLELAYKMESSIDSSEYVSNGFKGVFFRHLGELNQVLKNQKKAKKSYLKSLQYFEQENQVNIDTAQTHLSLGVIYFNESRYFDAVKHFNFAANIFNFLNYDLKEILHKLSLSLFNLSYQYLRTLRVFLFENDRDKVVDYLLKGINYLFLSILYQEKKQQERNQELCSFYIDLIDNFMETPFKNSEEEILTQMKDILGDFEEYLNISDINTTKKFTKENYEKLKEFQPLKIFYTMIIYKKNGIVMFSETSKVLEQMPQTDSDMIAGMIMAINGFLSEVLSGKENVFLIDRDNVKIVFEYTQNLIGILFINKESAKIRIGLKNLLQKIETKSIEDLENWSGEVTKFSYINELISKYLTS